MNVELSQGIPIPEAKRRYPYKVMQIGDSFFIEGGVIQIVCNANYRTSKKLGRKFIARKEGTGVRVWRTD